MRIGRRWGRLEQVLVGLQDEVGGRITVAVDDKLISRLISRRHGSLQLRGILVRRSRRIGDDPRRRMQVLVHQGSGEPLRRTIRPELGRRNGNLIAERPRLISRRRVRVCCACYGSMQAHASWRKLLIHLSIAKTGHSNPGIEDRRATFGDPIMERLIGGLNDLGRIGRWDVKGHVGNGGVE